MMVSSEYIELCRMRHETSTKKWWRIVRIIATGQHYVEWILDQALFHEQPWRIMCQFSSEMLGASPLREASEAVLKRLVDQYMSGRGVNTGMGAAPEISGGSLTGTGTATPPITLKPEYLDLIKAARAWVAADKACEAATTAVSRAQATVAQTERDWQIAAKRLVELHPEAT